VGEPTPRAVGRPRPLWGHGVRPTAVRVDTSANGRAGPSPVNRTRGRARPTRRSSYVDESVGRAVSRPRPSGRTVRTDEHRELARSRPIHNGPQPRSWGKPGRDAKSVVPGLRPGDRRARRRWPAAAGMFWRRELVACETVRGVVIDCDMRFVRRRPTGRSACDAGCVCHSACEMGRSPKLGRIPSSTGTGS